MGYLNSLEERVLDLECSTDDIKSQLNNHGETLIRMEEKINYLTLLLDKKNNAFQSISLRVIELLGAIIVTLITAKIFL